ncbi:MAG: penicillin-binding protein activator [Ignavibacteriaceae bacterium]|nr:penicillin-binding protein activator [Ignavibacteriaceae bacterium]
MINKFFIFSIVCLLMVSYAYPQQGKINTDSLFKKAVASYEKGLPEEALKDFLVILSSDSHADYAIPSYLFSAQISFELKNYFYAEKYIGDLEKKYPAHGYQFDIHLLRAKIHQVKENKIETLQSLINAMRAAENDSLRKSVSEFIEKFVRTEYDTASFRTVTEQFKGRSGEVYLMVLRASLMEQEGNPTGAKEIYLDIISRFPATPEANLSIAALQRARTEPVKIETVEEKIIAVLLPLTVDGNANPDALEVLNGIKYAADEYNKSRKEKVGLLIRDTERNETKISRIADEILAKKDIVAVLGPLYSDETTFLCSLLADADLPVVSPTANSNEIAATYPNFIQANPSVDMHAKIMARYMYFVEDVKSAGVFFSNEGYSRELAQIFRDEFERLGGKVIAENSYSINSVNMSPYISKFTALKGKLHGIYLPLSDRKSGEQILSAFVQDSLILPFFGNQDWITSGALQTSSRASEKFTITSENFMDQSDNNLKDFTREFTAVMESDVTRSTLYGYDCASLLLGLLSQREAAALKSRLTAGFDVTAFHNNYFIGEDRVNKSLNIIRYSKGQFNFVERFKLQ